MRWCVIMPHPHAGSFRLLISAASVCALPHPAPASPHARPDQLAPVAPGEVKITGFVGQRIDRNAGGILMHRDESELLEAFRHRTVGGHPWIGEYVGKWLSAASMAYDYAGEPAMRNKLDRVLEGLLATQLDDGYLGTYGEPERWKRWDLWVHKYNLLGLQACYDATGDQRALDACRRIADLIIHRFGPGKADILESGTHDGAVVHQGMAATSILQPFVGLYRRTGDEQYLAFADYIVDSLERPNGPHIVSTLLSRRSVAEVANAKAYEMISNILGLLEMYRVRGRPDLLEAARIAFDDILEHRTYVTGGSTYGEVFKEEGDLPNIGHVAEMCVMMSQLQLARELQLMTGDPACANAAEHLVLNHLLAGQHPTGEFICYYTPLWGHKFYMDFLACCISSGPRAIAMLPSLYYLRGQDRLVVNMIGPSEVNTTLGSGQRVHVVQETRFPFDGKVRILAQAAGDGGFTLAVRIPPSAHEPVLSVNGRTLGAAVVPGRYVELDVSGEPATIELDLHLRWEIIQGTGGNESLFALRYGPVIFACGDELNTDAGTTVGAAFDRDLERLNPRLESRPEGYVAHVNGHAPQRPDEWTPRRLTLVPFADAGQTSWFSVWLRDRAFATGGPPSLFTRVHEHVSRAGTHRGSFADNSSQTFTTTDAGERRDEDFFEVDAGWHCKFNVVVFRHGRSFPDGGWFDTSAGKPRVSIRGWHETHEVGVLQDYPDTTATDPGSLAPGQAFRFVIPPTSARTPLPSVSPARPHTATTPHGASRVAVRSRCSSTRICSLFQEVTEPMRSTSSSRLSLACPMLLTAALFAGHAAQAAEPPEWAVTECQGLKAYAEVVYHWLDRQNEDGSFGFGLDDDCEFYTGWTIFVYAADDQRILDSLRRNLDWVWYHERVQDGYQAEPGDAEHSSEITSYTQPLLTIADYGNPVLLERLMTTAKNMEHWTAVNAKGHRHFRAHWLGSQGVCDYAYFAADATIVGRATIPMMHLLWYNHDPDLARLCIEWGRAWVDHAKETTWGKPYGLLPGEVVFETDEAGGFTRNWWDSAASGFPLCDNAWYMNRLHEMLVLDYAITGDPEFLLPLRKTLEFYAEARPDNLPAGVTMWPAWMNERMAPRHGRKPEQMPFVWERNRGKIAELLPYYRWATGDDHFDRWYGSPPAPPTRQTALECGKAARDAAATALEVATTINIRDSVDNYRADINAAGYAPLYHGGSNWVDLPWPSVRWRNGNYELAVVLLDHRPTRFKALCCNTAGQLRRFGAQLFDLEPGTYHMTLGIDDNQDDLPDGLLRDELTFVERGTEITLDLEPGHEYLLELLQVAKSLAWTPRADPAVCDRDVYAVPAAPEPGAEATLRVRVHNVGASDTRQISVWAEEIPSGRFIAEQTIAWLPRPHNMVPSHVTVQMPWTVGSDATGVRVQVDPHNLVEEIYEGNNTAEIALADLPEAPLQKARIYIPNWWQQQQKGDVAQYTAPCVDSIVVDGKLDDPGWAMAERRGPLADLEGSFNNEKPTFVRVAYGTRAIYFAIEAVEPDMDLLVETAPGHETREIFADDAAEIFIDTNFDRRTYYQFACNTAGMKAEGQYYNFTIYNEPWECSIHKASGAWYAEVAIPYTSLKATPGPARPWGVNVYRNTKTFRAPDSQEQRRRGWKNGERNALSPTFGGHHEPHRFAIVTFAPKQ